MQSIRLAFTVSPDIKRKLKTLAEDKATTLSHWLRMAVLEAWTEREKSKYDHLSPSRASNAHTLETFHKTRLERYAAERARIYTWRDENGLPQGLGSTAWSGGAFLKHNPHQGWVAYDYESASVLLVVGRKNVDLTGQDCRDIWEQLDREPELADGGEHWEHWKALTLGGGHAVSVIQE